MYYEFYIDQFTAEHVIGGCLLLMITARVLKRKVPRWRIVAGSIVQTAVMLLFILQGRPEGYPAAWIAAGVCTFWKSSAEKNKKKFTGHDLQELLRAFGALAAVTVCFGGVLQAIMDLTELPVLAGTAAAAGILRSGIRCWLGWTETVKNLRTVTLQMGDYSLHLQALLDTGNSLREPLTGKPVSIISAAAARKVLEDGWEQEHGFFLIPYHSLGTEKSWMKGISIKCIQVEQEGKKTEVNNAVLAIYEGQISSTGRYQMILHPEHASGGRE